jgi:hypothetical protein
LLRADWAYSAHWACCSRTLTGAGIHGCFGKPGRLEIRVPRGSARPREGPLTAELLDRRKMVQESCHPAELKGRRCKSTLSRQHRFMEQYIPCDSVPIMTWASPWGGWRWGPRQREWPHALATTAMGAHVAPPGGVGLHNAQYTLPRKQLGSTIAGEGSQSDQRRMR